MLAKYSRQSREWIFCGKSGSYQGDKIILGYLGQLGGKLLGDHRYSIDYIFDILLTYLNAKLFFLHSLSNWRYDWHRRWSSRYIFSLSKTSSWALPPFPELNQYYKTLFAIPNWHLHKLWQIKTHDLHR